MKHLQKILSIEDLRYLSEPGILCHGVFDVLHAGHLKHFQEAKALDGRLVVSVTSDRYVNKGPGRPYFTAQVRAEMVAALEIVDHVVISDYPTAYHVIDALRPKAYVKGPDYRDATKDVTGEIKNECALVESYGGHVVFTDDETYSSSAILNRFFMPWTDQQARTIAQVKALGGMDAIESALNDASKLDVKILGEPIIDTYRFCAPENLSSKSPSVSARFLYEENYPGGTLAVANHLASFVRSALLITACGDDDWHRFGTSKVDPRVTLHLSCVNQPTPRKTRYISSDKQQRMFEITNLSDDIWEKPPNDLLHYLRQPADAHILCDFGHGFFEGEVLGACGDIPNFVGLNVQTNSSNFGFNPYTKHCRWDYLSLDTKEARVAFHDRLTSPLDLGDNVASVHRKVSLTLGPNGSCYYSDGSRFLSPAFTDHVVDAIGAGDAYFAITTLLVKVGAPAPIVPFVGNVFAGLKAKVLGNKTAVSKAQLLKALAGILK